jgi:hypothetical protein
MMHDTHYPGASDIVRVWPCAVASLGERTEVVVQQHICWLHVGDVSGLIRSSLRKLVAARNPSPLVFNGL